LKVLLGESPDAPPTLELRLQFFLELRPIFRKPGTTTTTTTTTMKPYERRRRGRVPTPPPKVVEWCERNLRRVLCGIWLRADALWRCVKCCPQPPRCGGDCLYKCPLNGSNPLMNGSNSQGFPSISYGVNGLPGVDLAAPGEPSELEWFAESPKQRVQDFKQTVDEETVPPENVSVTDGDCPVPFAIGGGCICKEGCSRARPYLHSEIISDTSLECEVRWFDYLDLLALPKTICGPRKVGTLIGGACIKYYPYDDVEIIAAFPEDQTSFRCLGTGEWRDEPWHQTRAGGYCLELEGNEKVIMV
ncbi:unnamed protein product, partial [Symbiodinium necroappetens]